MITGKQRIYLKKLAHQLDPTVYIGFESRELVKVKLQEGCDMKPADVANRLAAELDAEFVQAIGRKFVLYRPSKENRKIELPRK